MTCTVSRSSLSLGRSLQETGSPISTLWKVFGSSQIRYRAFVIYSQHPEIETQAFHVLLLCFRKSSRRWSKMQAFRRWPTKAWQQESWPFILASNFSSFLCTAQTSRFSGGLELEDNLADETVAEHLSSLEGYQTLDSYSALTSLKKEETNPCWSLQLSLVAAQATKAFSQKSLVWFCWTPANTWLCSVESGKTSTHTVLKLPHSLSVTDAFQRDNGSLEPKDALN